MDWTLRWGPWLWAVALALAVPATWRTASLYAHLRSELEQLLPATAPSVVALDELRARMPSLRHLGVVVDSATPDNLPAAVRLVDDLAARVRAYPPDLVQSVRTGDAEERRFLEDHAPLYMDVADLETLRRRVEARRDWEVAHATGALLDDDSTAPPLGLGDIERPYGERAPGRDRYASDTLHLALLLVQLGASDADPRRGQVLLQRVKADVAALDPASYSPALRVGFTGDVAINVEETDALKADLTLSTALVAVLEIAVILAYYRWWKSLVLLLPPLALAAVFAFALASVWPLGVTELNSNTAFLGSIIAGNGVNFGIILLARYVEERRTASPVPLALAVAVDGARGPTFAAALAAAASYASLALTDFRGFRQFGLVGGVGMALAWALTFLLVPPLAAWVDRAPRLPSVRRAPMAVVGGLVRRHAVAIAWLSAALAMGAAWEARHLGAARLETDFSTLRRADTWTRGEGYWGRRMDALLGTYLTPTVILTDEAAQSRAIAAELSEEITRPPLDSLVARVRTIDQVVPPGQIEKISIVEQIRGLLTPGLLASLPARDRERVERVLGRGPLGPIGLEDLPAGLTTGLRERDGRAGREVLVFPKPVHALWEGPALADLVSRLRSVAGRTASPGQRPGRVAGSLPLSNDILEAIRRDAALSCLTAFAGVAAVVLLLFRASRATGLVLGSLLLGVLWLGAATVALDIKINFANFIAFPITFGIGVDYAVNVASRAAEQPSRSMAGVVSTTGGAVVLCSMTTVIGYSSLLVAQNRALFLFGLVAVLGEIACLTSAVVVMPAVVECLRLGRTAPAPEARR